MSEYIDERIVSIKFDNSGFAEGVSETQKQLDSLNKSLEFDGAAKGVDELSKAFKDVSNEAKNTDLSPIRNAVENISDKFSALGGIATGVLFKIGSDAVDAGKKLIKSISIDPIAKGFDKYQQILSAQMTMIASLGGETEEEVKRNKEQIEDSMKILTWYADETSASLQDMLSNLSSFSKYGIDLDVATDAIMGIANAGFKAGIAIPQITHALEGFSKSIGQGFVSYQTWKTWIHSSGIDTVEFKNTFIDAAKQMLKEGAELGDGVRLLGDQLQYYAGKNEGWINITAEAMENSLTKGKWLTNDVLMNGLTRYNAAMRDVYELTEQGARSVADLTDEEKALVDQTSLAAFLFGQQSKTLTEVTDAMQDAITTAWATIFKSLIGDYEQTVQIWSDMAEYVWEFFVIPLQNVSNMLEEFGKSTSNIFDETTGKFLTMREVIVGSIMNIFEAIKSVIDPIKEAFEVVFRPFETVPEKLQNGVESFYNFTQSLILTKDEAEKLRNKFVAVFNVLKAIGEVVKTVIDLAKKYVWPIIKKVASFAIKIIKVIGTALIKLISTISSFVSRVFGIRDIVADIKEDILSAAEAIDEMSESADDGSDSLDNFKSKLSDSDDSMKKYASGLSDVTNAMEDLTDAEEKNSKASSKKEKDYTISGGYDGTSYLSYYQAMEKANNKRLAEFIKEKGITEKQYNQVIKMLEASDKGYYISLSEMAESSGLALDTMSELYKIINQTTVAYDKTERAISDILNKDAEAKKWETIWDGINEAQKATLITYGDQETALQMYFKQGIKDYKQIADVIGIEEWKIREVISAYQEAYDVEELLAKKKLEVNADNIDAARQELGYIERKNEEKKKEQELTERDKSIAERNARIAERNKRIQTSANKTTSKSVQVISSAIKQIPIIGTAFTALGKVFGSTSKATKNSSKSVNESLHSVRSNIDELSNNKFITTKDNFYEVKESADAVSDSVKDIADTSEKASNAVKKSTAVMNDAFKNFNSDVKDSTDGIKSSIDKVVEASNKSKSGTKSGSSSLVSQVSSLFEGTTNEVFDFETLKDKAKEALEWIKDKAFSIFGLIKDKALEKIGEVKDKIINKIKELKSKSLQELFDPIISKIKEIWTTFKNVFANIQSDISGFFKEPLQTIEKVINDIKDGFRSIFHKNDEEDKEGIGIAATDILSEETKNEFLVSIDDLLNKTWEKIKQFFKNRVDAARNDEDNPFHGLIDAFDNIVNWWDDFSFDVQKYVNRIKDAFKVVFGEGSLFEKLQNSSLWRPLLDLADSIITKIDNLQMNIKNIKLAIHEGITNAMADADSSIGQHLVNIKDKFDDLVEKIKAFKDNVIAARDIFLGKGTSGGGGSDPDAEAPGGLVGLIGRLLAKWEDFKEKTKDGIDWDTIIKVKELESILESLVLAIGRAWLNIGLGKMAADIGSFFKSIGDSIEGLADSVTKHEDLGKILIEIAIAIALLAGTFFALGQMDVDAIQRATDAIQALAAILVPVFTIVAGFTRLLQQGGLGNATSIPQALANGIQSLFGQKNTMSQAAKLILGIGGGIYLLAEAFAVLGEATKDMKEAQWKRTLETLGIISAIVVSAMIIIRLFLANLGGKGSLSFGGIDFNQKTINRTVVPAAEILKSFAEALLALIAGFAAIAFVIDKYLSKEDGSINNTKFAAVTGTLAGMVIATIAMMMLTIHELQKVQGMDFKVVKQFNNIMKPFLMGIGTMIYGFKELTKIIDNIKKPDTFKKAVGLFIGMTIAVGLFMFITVALCKWLLSEKYSSSSKSNSGIFGSSSSFAAGDFVNAKAVNKSYSGSKGNDVGDVLKQVSAIIISLGFGVKLIASAFATLTTAIDGIKKSDTFKKAVGVFIGIFVGVILLIAALTAAAAFTTPDDALVIKAMGLVMIEIAAAVWIIGHAIADLSKAFADIQKSDQGKEAVNKALITIGVFVGGIIALFAILAVLSATGVGGAALAVAAAILVAIATALLEIAAAVYVFARGLESLVNTLIKAASANKELAAGIDALIALMPKVRTLVTETIKALVMGVVDARAEIATAIVETIEAILTVLDEHFPKIRSTLLHLLEMLGDTITVAVNNWLDDRIQRAYEWGNRIIDLFLAILQVLTNRLPDITEAWGNFLYAMAESIVEMFYTGGRIFVKLLEIPKAIAAGIIDELKNRFGLNKDGTPITNPNDPDSSYGLGIGFVKSIIQAIKDWIANGKIGEAAHELWEAIKGVFTNKDNADINSPSKTTYKWGQYIVEGTKNGIEDTAPEVGDSAETLWAAFSDPMSDNANSFSGNLTSIFSSMFAKGSTNSEGAAGEAGFDLASTFGGFFSDGMEDNTSVFGDSMTSMFADVSTLSEGAAGEAGFDLASIFGDSFSGTLDANSSDIGTDITSVFSGSMDVEAISASGSASGESLLSGFSSFIGDNSNSVAEDSTDSIIDAFDDNNTNDKIYTVGVEAGIGFLDGFEDEMEAGKKSTSKVVQEFIDLIKTQLDIHSPSKVMHKLGEFTGKGFALGIDDTSKIISNSAIYIGEVAIESLSDQISSFAAVTSSMLSQILDADMDINPVITPVFDMSNLDAASSSMSAFFDAQDALEVASSFNGMQKSRIELENNQNEGNVGNNSGATYNYVQNNYSPKALSEIEIYRRTKNQLNFKTYLS